VVVEGPIIKIKWSHITITFTVVDIKLISFPHIDIMVITVHIDKWDVTRVLVDNGSQAEILFFSTFDQMSYYRRQLKEATKPLYAFRGERIEPAGTITVPAYFENPKNVGTKFITFDVWDINYPYNAIFSRGLLNTSEASFHLVYLFPEVPASLGVISIFGS
jgi:hypothetical protein